MHSLSNKQLISLGIGLAIIIFLVALFGTWYSPSQSSMTSSGSQTLPPPTPPTQAQLQQLQNTPPFQYLVSYTNSGFEPSQLTVKEGQTVRFANNSSEELWIASVGQGSDLVYPGASSCNGSAFDSCEPIAQGSYWEFTFDQSGTWEFQNNLDKNDSGTVTVR